MIINMAVDVAALKRVLGLFVCLCVTRTSLQREDADGIVYSADGKDTTAFGSAKPMRFLLYDVNPGEGFNLRRDVYIRVANLVKFLNEDEPWTLVLPPWGRLYHWKSNIDQIKVPWGTFFDLESLGRHVPVMEYKDFIKMSGGAVIEEVYYLQRYKEGWKDGKWEERMDIRDCLDQNYYHKDEEGAWRGWFWGYEETKAKKLQCLSVQAQASSMKPFLMHNTTARSVMFPMAQTIIHGQWDRWSPWFWNARRSMRFSKQLRDIADKFREQELDSTDEKDRTVLLEDWTKMRRKHGDALGGPYLSIHLRRRDYLYAHKEEVPSLLYAAEQIKSGLEKHKLKTVFVATDAPKEEFEELKGYLQGYKVVKYTPTKEVLESFKDGGIAIIDQWICAHARVFIGSYVSTFSFRIQEEREILGFSQDVTYRRFCPDGQLTCEQPSKWVVKYDEENQGRGLHTEL
ncbi:GDP-fucose protein O-fucosyltransferase 2 isoform X2 [Lingula anatina]|uniref:GDP-fucose protein O-fucosyltransferase 2 n=1 Tax=Lingula anatina TaxID=7574 RepID=A0A1S3ICS5_LINAN|nr:GDP-fucose protein O-fucosyltransferase 2 isoform X2 [Lingula anatina]|eukprot:XP_013395968.2 GDP-fucose protein O-fucosyltransferase 2 isoform X2 [Lingula anatina]